MVKHPIESNTGQKESILRTLDDKFVKLFVASTRNKLMQNNNNCILPVIDEKTGEPTSFLDPEYGEKLKKERPANYKLLKLLESYIEEITGMSIDEIRSLDFKDRIKKTQLAKKLEEGIIKTMPFLEQNKSLAQKKEHMFKLGETANDYYDSMINKFLKSESKYIGWENSVAVENNIGKLIVKYLSNSDPIMRAEAKLKLFLMIHLGMIYNHSRYEIDLHESLGFFMDLINEKITHYRDDKRIGSFNTKYLVSRHAKDDNRTLSVELLDSEDKWEKEDNSFMEPISMREAIVKDEKGNERRINFFIEARKKNLFSKTSKAIRYKDEPIRIDKDYNGVRLVFEKYEDHEDFLVLLEEKFKMEYRNELMEQYKLFIKKNDEESANSILDRMKEVDSCVEIKINEIKDNLKVVNKKEIQSSDDLEIGKYFHGDIIIVDDDEIYVDGTERLLKNSFGIDSKKIFKATDRKTALEIVKKIGDERPLLVLSDVYMKMDMNISEFVNKLSEINKKVSTSIFTGYAGALSDLPELDPEKNKNIGSFIEKGANVKEEISKVIREFIIKNKLGYKGSSVASSKNYRAKQIDFIYIQPDGKKMRYEIQIMLLDGYRDMQMRDDVNIREYDIKRVFKRNEKRNMEQSLMEILVSPIIFKRLNLDKSFDENVQRSRFILRNLLFIADNK